MRKIISIIKFVYLWLTEKFFLKLKALILLLFSLILISNSISINGYVNSKNIVEVFNNILDNVIVKDKVMILCGFALLFLIVLAIIINLIQFIIISLTLKKSITIDLVKNNVFTVNNKSYIILKSKLLIILGIEIIARINFKHQNTIKDYRVFSKQNLDGIKENNCDIYFLCPGLYILDKIEIFSRDILGFTNIYKKINKNILINVLPNSPISKINIDTLAYSDETMNRTSIVNIKSDYYDTREYQFGDDTRRIHWKQSAKNDNLIVRIQEIEDPIQEYMNILFVFTRPKEFNNSNLEIIKYNIYLEIINAVLNNYNNSNIDIFYAFDSSNKIPKLFKSIEELNKDLIQIKFKNNFDTNFDKILSKFSTSKLINQNLTIFMLGDSFNRIQSIVEKCKNLNLHLNFVVLNVNDYLNTCLHKNRASKIDLKKIFIKTNEETFFESIIKKINQRINKEDFYIKKGRVLEQNLIKFLNNHFLFKTLTVGQNIRNDDFVSD